MIFYLRNYDTTLFCDNWRSMYAWWTTKKGKKVTHTRLPSIGFRSWSQCLAVSLQVRWVINPAVGCHYFPTGLQLPPQPLRGLQPVLLLGVNSLPKTVTWQHHGCDLNQGRSESSTLTTRLPSHPDELLLSLKSLNGLFSKTTWVSQYQKGNNKSGFYWSKRQWVAVASAGPCSSRRLTADR